MCCRSAVGTVTVMGISRALCLLGSSTCHCRSCSDNALTGRGKQQIFSTYSTSKTPAIKLKDEDDEIKNTIPWPLMTFSVFP